MRRLLIVAEDARTAQTIRSGLRHATNCSVIGYVSGRRPCVDAVRAIAPDVVVIDDAGAGRSTLDRIRDVHLAGCPKIVLVTIRMDPDWLQRITAAGAHAAVSRSVHSAGLGTLVREITSDSVYHAFAPAPPAPAELKPSGLTARELQILRLVASGSPNSQIARQLWVTEQTVKFHLSNIYRKLGVANRTEASHYAHIHGVLQPVATAVAA